MAPICEACGKAFSIRRGQNRYCRECAVERPKLRKAQKRRSQGIAQIGDAMICGECGLSVVKTRPGQRFCPDCRRLRDLAKFRRFRARHRDRYLAYYQACDRKRIDDPRRKEQKRKDWRKRALKRQADPYHRLHHRMSQGIRNALKGTKAGRSWPTILGYTRNDLICHLERQFPPSMTWGNFGKWQIDHIVPKRAFYYTSENDPDFRACWALSNLRPLWREKNRQKSGERTHLI
jgi:hypothetical protein